MLRLIIIALAVFLLWRFLSSLSAKRDARRVDGPPPGGARSPWEVLEVQPGASPEEIRLAYQVKIRQYHPDKVANLGPELRELAERHTKEINAAYETLRGER